MFVFIYLFDCARFQLQHAESLIFVVACRIFSCGMGDLLVISQF